MSPSPDTPPAVPERVETGQAAPVPVAGGISLLAAALAAGLLSALVAGIGATYDSVKEADGLARVDRPMLDWMIGHRSPTLDSVVTAFTNIGGPTLLPMFMFVATAGSLAMTAAGKDLAARVRPPHSLAVPPLENSPSFPSGHTLNSTVIAIVLSYLVVLHVDNRRARTSVITALAVYAMAMGLSRVFLGHHWFTDVVAGWVAGVAWGLAVVFAHRLLLALQRQRHEQHQRHPHGTSQPVE